MLVKSSISLKPIVFPSFLPFPSSGSKLTYQWHLLLCRLAAAAALGRACHINATRLTRFGRLKRQTNCRVRRNGRSLNCKKRKRERGASHQTKLGRVKRGKERKTIRLMIKGAKSGRSNEAYSIIFGHVLCHAEHHIFFVAITEIVAAHFVADTLSPKPIFRQRTRYNLLQSMSDK